MDYMCEYSELLVICGGDEQRAEERFASRYPRLAQEAKFWQAKSAIAGEPMDSTLPAQPELSSQHGHLGDDDPHDDEDYHYVDCACSTSNPPSGSSSPRRRPVPFSEFHVQHIEFHRSGSVFVDRTVNVADYVLFVDKFPSRKRRRDAAMVVPSTVMVVPSTSSKRIQTSDDTT